MTQAEMAKTMSYIFAKCQELREAGQKEYAHELGNAFRNFEQIGAELQLDRKKILWVYAKKHVDGIIAAINGHMSQREDVRGRIYDLIVYLCLLHGMFDEDERRSRVQAPMPNETMYQYKTSQEVRPDMELPQMGSGGTL